MEKYFQKIRRKITNFLDRDKEKLEAKPYRDWAKIVGIFSLINFFVIMAALFLFAQINQGGIFNAGESDIVLEETINERTIANVIEKFEKRAQTFESMLSKKPLLPDDPSL